MTEAERTLNQLCIDYQRYLGLGDIDQVEADLERLRRFETEYGSLYVHVSRAEADKAKKAAQAEIVPGVVYRLSPDGQGGWLRSVFDEPPPTPTTKHYTTDQLPPANPTEGQTWFRKFDAALFVFSRGQWDRYVIKHLRYQHEPIDGRSGADLLDEIGRSPDIFESCSE